MAERETAADLPHGLDDAATAAGVGSQPLRVGFAAKLGDPFRGDDVGEVGIHDSASVADASQDAIERMRYTET